MSEAARASQDSAAQLTYASTQAQVLSALLIELTPAPAAPDTLLHTGSHLLLGATERLDHHQSRIQEPNDDLIVSSARGIPYFPPCDDDNRKEQNSDTILDTGYGAAQ